LAKFGFVWRNAGRYETVRLLWDTLESLDITPRHAWESERKRAEAESGSTVETRIAISSPGEGHGGNGEYNPEEDEDHEDENEEVREARTAAVVDDDDRVRHVPRQVRSLKRPEQMPPSDIQRAILQSPQKCPNYSCTLKPLTSRVLKELGVVTRGNPRLEFEKRVMRNLGVLKGKGRVEEHKAKNRRIRLPE
jgi:hypothetical protein